MNRCFYIGLVVFNSTFIVEFIVQAENFIRYIMKAP